MILKELFEKTQQKKGNGEMPYRTLLGMKEPIVAEYETTMKNESLNVHIRVFKSGYVLYEEDGSRTIFHLDDLFRVYSGSENSISEEILMNTDWQVGVILAGNERIQHNLMEKEKRHREYSYSGIAEDFVNAFYYDDYEFLLQIDEEIRRQKAEEVFQILKDSMKPIQWEVYILAKRDELQQEKIAAILGKSQSTISKNYLIACNTVMELRGQLKKKYYEL